MLSLKLVIFFMLLEEASSAHQGCIHLIKNTLKHQNYETLIQFNCFLFYFQHQFQSSLSRDPSEITLL